MLEVVACAIMIGLLAYLSSPWWSYLVALFACWVMNLAMVAKTRIEIQNGQDGHYVKK